MKALQNILDRLENIRSDMIEFIESRRDYPKGRFYNNTLINYSQQINTLNKKLSEYGHGEIYQIFLKNITTGEKLYVLLSIPREEINLFIEVKYPGFSILGKSNPIKLNTPLKKPFIDMG